MNTQLPNVAAASASDDFLLPEVTDRPEITPAYPDSHLLVRRKLALSRLRTERHHAIKEERKRAAQEGRIPNASSFEDDTETKLLPRDDVKCHWSDVINVDYSRNSLLTAKGRDTLDDRYGARGDRPDDLDLKPDPQHIFARVAWAGADDPEHGQRLYDYISQLWFMPATPILTNLGTDRGLPISCFLQPVSDSLNGITRTYNEAIWMGARGGGIGTYWGSLRGIGEKVADNGVTSGIIPFVKIQDSLTQGINQGGVRRGSGASYLDISHPEILEFIKLRDPSGDFNRKALNLHHGVLITDEFMEAVKRGDQFPLRSPKTGAIHSYVDARELYQEILEVRLKTGEPYIIYIDTVNRARPSHHVKLGLTVSTSNLCSEITLPTGLDHQFRERSAVCCLSSVNLVYWDKWSRNDQFFEDIYRFLDNILTDFILRAPEALSRAVYSAFRERSVGLGVMGFHTFLQSKFLPIKSALARSYNRKFFKTISDQAKRCSVLLAEERGSCPDAIDAGEMRRFSYQTAIAPTASISIIAGGASAAIEPIPANVYNHKTLSGNHQVRNPHLEALLENKGINTPRIWSSMIEHGGSVQHLSQLTDEEKEVFKTAFELDQFQLLTLQADRTPFIDQATSFNIFLPADVDKWDLMMLHLRGWEMGIKSFYYCRSKSVQQAANLFVEGHGDVSADNTMEPAKFILAQEPRMYDECEVCQ